MIPPKLSRLFLTLFVTVLAQNGICQSPPIAAPSEIADPRPTAEELLRVRSEVNALAIGIEESGDESAGINGGGHGVQITSEYGKKNVEFMDIFLAKQAGWLFQDDDEAFQNLDAALEFGLQRTAQHFYRPIETSLNEGQRINHLRSLMDTIIKLGSISADPLTSPNQYYFSSHPKLKEDSKLEEVVIASLFDGDSYPKSFDSETLRRIELKIRSEYYDRLPRLHQAALWSRELFGFGEHMAGGLDPEMLSNFVGQLFSTTPPTPKYKGTTRENAIVCRHQTVANDSVSKSESSFYGYAIEGVSSNATPITNFTELVIAQAGTSALGPFRVSMNLPKIEPQDLVEIYHGTSLTKKSGSLSTYLLRWDKKAPEVSVVQEVQWIWNSKAENLHHRLQLRLRDPKTRKFGAYFPIQCDRR